MMNKFKALAVMPIEELDRLEIKHKSGWVEGSLVDEWIVGDVIDVTEEYIAFSFWVKVHITTLISLEGEMNG